MPEKKAGALPENGAAESLLGALCELGVAQEGYFEDAILDGCSLEWYKRAATKGNASSLVRLGFHELSNSENYEAAYSYLKKALQSEDYRKQFYLSDINFVLGLMIVTQTGTQEPRENAIQFIKSASEGEHAEAGYLLGLLYANGLLGLPVDQGKAREFIQDSVDDLNLAQINELMQTVSELRTEKRRS